MADISISELPPHSGRTRRSGRREAARRPTGGSIRIRIRLAMVVFALVFAVIVGRLVLYGMTEPATARNYVDPNAAMAASRPRLVDNSGEILATDIKTASLYGEPRNIIDPDEAAEAIVTVLPELDVNKLRKRLSGDAGFAWI